MTLLYESTLSPFLSWCDQQKCYDGITVREFKMCHYLHDRLQLRKKSMEDDDGFSSTAIEHFCEAFEHLWMVQKEQGVNQHEKPRRENIVELFEAYARYLDPKKQKEFDKAKKLAAKQKEFDKKKKLAAKTKEVYELHMGSDDRILHHSSYKTTLKRFQAWCRLEHFTDGYAVHENKLLAFLQHFVGNQRRKNQNKRYKRKTLNGVVYAILFLWKVKKIKTAKE